MSEFDIDDDKKDEDLDKTMVDPDDEDSEPDVTSFDDPDTL